jgi:cysteine-rich repeat protein
MCNTMRTSILCAAFLGLFAAGCAGDLSGTDPGGDDTQGGPDCGNGTVDQGEACDDGNTASGDGCSSACVMEVSSTPKLNVTHDKPTVSTELNTETMITVTLTGQGGFGEAVNLTGTIVDAAGATVPGWTVTFNPATVNVPVDGTATAVATVKVPSVNQGLIGIVKINAASSLGTTTAADSTFTALNQVSFDIRNNGAQCANDFSLTPVSVKVGTMVRFVNKFTTGLVTVHVQDGTASGVPHEPDPGHAPNTAYERTITAVGNGTFTWYCHAPGPNPATDPSITVVP